MINDQEDKKLYALKMTRMMLSDEPVYYAIVDHTSNKTLGQVIEDAINA